MEIRLDKNVAGYVSVPMIDSATPESFKTGLTVTDTAYYKDGAGAWTSLAITDTFTEIASTGMYECDLTAAELNHDQIMIKLTASGAADSAIIIRTTPAPVRLADAVSHGGTLGSSTATLALSRINVTSQTANTNGVTVNGNGTGHGLACISVDGDAISAQSDNSSGLSAVSLNSNGITIQGLGGNGIYCVGDVSGIEIASLTSGAPALRATGNGSGAGMKIIGGATGIGLDIDGGATSGAGLTIDSTTGDAVSITSAAGNGDAIQLTPHGTGFGINGTINGNITGNLSGSVGSVTGAVGSVTSNVGGNVTGSVGSIAAGGIASTSFAAGAIDAAAIAADAIGSSELATSAVAEIADAVWDEILSGHAGAGSTGEALAAAGAAGDPWITALPGAYGAGSAGYIIGTNVNATISSRASQTSVDTIDGIVDSILVDTAEIGAAGAGLTALASAANLATVDTVVDSILVDTAEIGVAGAGLTALASAANLAIVDTVVDAILVDTGTSGVIVVTNNDKTGYAIGVGGIAATAFAAGAVNAAALAADAGQEIADEILDRNLAGGGSGSTRNIRNALRALRNKQTISGGTLTVYQEDDTTSAWTAAVTTAAGNPITNIDPV